MSKIIELKDVTKVYQRGSEKVHAIDGVSLAIKEGEFLAITGPSGSGKTTLLNLIGCVDRPTSGSIKIGEIETVNLKDEELTEIRSTRIGFVFQQFFLLPTLTVLENVELPTIFAKKSKKVLQSRARELLKLVGLEKRENHFPSDISGGEMQRVAIARALINSPKILLADEPTGNLDSQNAQVVIEIFKKLNSEGITVILVTHNIDLANLASNRIILKDGKILNK
ncbi:MAG: ABC transporter ATP-binding protein [Candidatus Aenigmatarchaeota archaeon]